MPIAKQQTKWPFLCMAIYFSTTLPYHLYEQTATFKVEAYNHLSEKTIVGGEHFIAAITTPQGFTQRVDASDHRDGSYSFSYRPCIEGLHHMVVTLRGAPVAQSPYSINVRLGRCVLPHKDGY